MTMRSVLPCICAIAATVLAAAPVAAQQADEPVNSLERGRRSLSFSLPDGGGASFGYWVMRSEQTNLGIDVGFRINRSIIEGNDDPMNYSISVGPALRRYVVLDGHVAPFLQGGIDLSYGSRSVGGGDERSIGLRPTVGLGVEWFPVRSISIGGYAGIGIGYARTRVDLDTGTDPDPTQTLSIGTFTSALALRIYFGGWREDRGGAVAEGS